MLAEPHRRLVLALTERRLHRGVFSSVPHLIEAIEVWAEHWNDDPKPFVWHKHAEDIMAKPRRGRAAPGYLNSNPRRTTTRIGASG